MHFTLIHHVTRYSVNFIGPTIIIVVYSQLSDDRDKRLRSLIVITVAHIAD